MDLEQFGHCNRDCLGTSDNLATISKAHEPQLKNVLSCGTSLPIPQFGHNTFLGRAAGSVVVSAAAAAAAADAAAAELDSVVDCFSSPEKDMRNPRSPGCCLATEPRRIALAAIVGSLVCCSSSSNASKGSVEASESNEPVGDCESV